jgi:hypothetical protein
VAKKKTARPIRSAGTDGILQPPGVAVTALGGGSNCPIEPQPPSDREIPGGMSDGQLGAAIRQLTTQGRVTVLWTCNQRLWLRSIRSDSPSTLHVG